MVKESTHFVIAMDINSINDHSPWWARAFAIFLGFMLLLTVANFFYLEIFGINGINHYTFADAPQDPGVYPGNGTEEEQRDYNNSLREWEDYQSYKEMMDDLEDSYVTEISQIFAVLTLLIGIPTIAMFWTQHEKMLHFGLAFGAVSIIGEVWKAYISSEIVANFMESIPGGGDYAWIAKTSIITSSMCGIFYIALAIVLHNMYHNLNDVPQSGFHLKVDTPSAEAMNHGDNDIQH